MVGDGENMYKYFKEFLEAGYKADVSYPSEAN
jgi:hypothetical protein